MHPINELKQLREQMIEHLTQIPEYQALKAMERFISELSTIYESSTGASAAGGAAQSEPSAPKPASVVVENRPKNEVVPASPRITPYIPAHRVA